MSAILGIIGGALSGISNAYTNETNRQINEQTNRVNMAMNRAQIDYAREEAEKADERTRALYNDLYSPQAKMNQLREAGLSPALMYGMSGAGGTSSTSGAQAATPTNIPTQGYQVTPLFNAELMTILANAAKTRAETENIKADTENKNKDLDVKDQTIKLMQAEEDETRQRCDVEYQNVLNLIEQRKNIAQDTKNKEALEELTKMQKEVEEINKKLLSNDLLYRDDMNYWAAQKVQEEFYQLIDMGQKLKIEKDVWDKYMDAMIKEKVSQAMANAANAALSEADKKWLEEQARALKRATDAEEYLDNLLQEDDTDKNGKGGGVRKALKEGGYFILQAVKAFRERPKGK